MIAFLTGKLAGRSTTAAFIDVGGVGYAVSMSQASLAKLPEAGAEVHVLTYLQVREDALALYGFLSAEEKALFERLISVSGVGPKVALAALSSFSPRTLADAIAAQDVALVSRIPGVGKKTAQRIVLELKDKLEDQSFQTTAGGTAAVAAEAEDGPLEGVSEAVSALISLGYSKSEASEAIASCGLTDVTAEEYIRAALKKLSRL